MKKKDKRVLLSIFKSDIFRISKMPSFYWSSGIIFVFSFAVPILAAAGVESITMGSLYINAMSLLEFSPLGATIALFVNIFTTSFIAKDFRSNFIRVIIPRGISRNDYFLSKILSAFFVSLAFNLISMITKFIVAGLFLDFGVFRFSLFLFLFSQIIGAFCWASFATMLVMFFKTSSLPLAISISANLFAGIAVGIIQALLKNVWNIKPKFSHFWFGFAFDDLAKHTSLVLGLFAAKANTAPTGTIEQVFLRGFLVSTVWMALMIAAAYYNFSKSELK